MPKRIIVEKTTDDSGFLIALILLIIFAIVFWNWAVPTMQNQTYPATGVDVNQTNPSPSMNPTTSPGNTKVTVTSSPSRY